MSDSSTTQPSERIIALFNEFRQNEVAIEQLKMSLIRQGRDNEIIDRQIQSTRENVGRMELEHHQLQKALANENERAKAVEEQIQKEKQVQLSAYSSLQNAEADLKNIESMRLAHRTHFAREMRARNEKHLAFRRPVAESILTGLNGQF